MSHFSDMVYLRHTTFATCIVLHCFSFFIFVSLNQVDHTITLYLVDPNGHFIDYYGRSKTSEEIITSVHVNIGKWETLHKPKKWFWQS